ncbi:Kazal-type serine protease inhibitor domain protein [Cooperia oncophora]
MSVCGSDGTTYDSMCQLIQFACKHQLDLVAVSLGICSDDRKSNLNLEMEEDRVYGINKHGLHLHMNITLTDWASAMELKRSCLFYNRRVEHLRRKSTMHSAPLNLRRFQGSGGVFKREGPKVGNGRITLTPRSSNGVILFARGDRNIFTLRMEMRRLVAE